MIMDDMYEDYRKFISIGLGHEQIKDCMVVVHGYTYQEIEAARAMVANDKTYWVDEKNSKEWPDCEARQQWDTGINSATAQDWDAVRPDMVNSPPHYTSGGIETIDFIKAKLSDEGYRGYLQGNLLKYASRIGKKGSDDAGKAAWYADRLDKL